VLLSLTGFIVVGFGRSTTVDLGFNTHNLYFLNLDPVRNGLAPTEAAQKVELLRQRLQQMQGTTAVSLAQGLPVAFTSGESIAASKMELVEGAGAAGLIRSDRIGDGFFEAAGLAVLLGRGFTQQDISNGARVIVVNETMAKREWPGRNSLGQTLELEAADSRS